MLCTVHQDFVLVVVVAYLKLMAHAVHTLIQTPAHTITPLEDLGDLPISDTVFVAQYLL